VVGGQVTKRRSRRGNGYLAAAGIAVALAASACASSNGSGVPKAAQTVVTTTAPATPDPATTTDDSQVALRHLLSGISTGKAQLAQYQQDLNAACGSGLESQDCWVALHYSKTIGTEITDNLAWVSQPPAEVVDLWKSTYFTALGLGGLDNAWCAPDRDFIGCYSHLIGTVQRLTQQFAGWDPYYPLQ
jgi:hypothetical protein